MAERCQDCGEEYEAVYRLPDELRAELTKRTGFNRLCLNCADGLAKVVLGVTLYWEAEQK